MKRNMFGDPKPKGHEEIVEAIDEKGINPAEAEVEISFQESGEEPDDFDGFSAEVRGASDEIDDEIDDLDTDQCGTTYSEFQTLGYVDRDELVKDLQASGLTAAK